MACDHLAKFSSVHCEQLKAPEQIVVERQTAVVKMWTVGHRE